MDSKVQYIDDSKPIPDIQLYRVRGVLGFEWAVPLYKGTRLCASWLKKECIMENSKKEI